MKQSNVLATADFYGICMSIWVAMNTITIISFSLSSISSVNLASDKHINAWSLHIDSSTSLVWVKNFVNLNIRTGCEQYANYLLVAFH